MTPLPASVSSVLLVCGHWSAFLSVLDILASVIYFFVFLLFCACVRMWMCVIACMYMYVCGETEDNLRCHPQEIVHCLWDCFSLAWSSPVKLDCLPGILLCPPLQCWKYKCELLCSAFHGCWRSNSGSYVCKTSSLPTKPFPRMHLSCLLLRTLKLIFSIFLSFLFYFIITASQMYVLNNTERSHGLFT